MLKPGRSSNLTHMHPTRNRAIWPGAKESAVSRTEGGCRTQPRRRPRARSRGAILDPSRSRVTTASHADRHLGARFPFAELLPQPEHTFRPGSGSCNGCVRTRTGQCWPVRAHGSCRPFDPLGVPAAHRCRRPPCAPGPLSVISPGQILAAGLITGIAVAVAAAAVRWRMPAVLAASLGALVPPTRRWGRSASSESCSYYAGAACRMVG